MAYYLVHKRGKQISKEDIETALKSHAEKPPQAHETETNGLWAIELENELAKKLIKDGFSVSLCSNGSAQ